MNIVLSPEFWLQTAVYIIGGASAVVAIAYRIAKIEAGFATKEELAKQITERDEKIAKVYKRFDEYKNFTESTLVRKDMCSQMHVQSRDEIKRLDEDAKNFRHDIRSTVQAIYLKIDELSADIRDLILGKNNNK
jgi:uncharacterized coiled-coil DUF342 family protein